MTDLILSGNKLICKKDVWQPNDILTAQCFNYKWDDLLNEVIIDLSASTKVALNHFLRNSFVNIYEGIEFKKKRDDLFPAISDVYIKLYNEFFYEAQHKLPYFGKLYAHQQEGLFWTRWKKNNLLSWDMRLGKSIATLSISKLSEPNVTLIICPGSTKFTTWYDDSAGWGFDKSEITVLDSKKKWSIKAFHEKFLVVNFEMLNKSMNYILDRNIEHIVVDECHKIKGHNTRGFNNVFQIVNAFPKSRITLLSGTPIANRVDDLFAYFKLTGNPLGASYKHFIKSYGIVKNGRGGDKISGAKNHEDLSIKLSNFMIRKTQKECFDLPPKVQIKYRIDKDDFKEEYDRHINDLKNEKNKSAIQGHLFAINRLTSLIKVPQTIEIAEDIIECDKKVVIFSSFTDTLMALQDHFKQQAVLINGSVSMGDRRDIIKQFWDNPKVKVFLGNTRSMGEGTNLSCASEIIRVDLPFTVKDIDQPNERCTMPTDPKTITIHYLLCEDSVDEIIFNLLVDKKMDIDKIIDKGQGSDSINNITDEIYKRLFEYDNLP